MTVVEIAESITALGVVVGVVGLRLNRVQMRRAFEDFYVRRYWQVMDDFTPSALLGELPTDPALVEEKDRWTSLRYLILCEDEIDVYTKRYISTDTWQMWRDGILAGIERWPVSVEWTRIKELPQSDRTQPFRNLEKLEAEQDIHRDPPRWLPRWVRSFLVKEGADGQV